jgi:hypothetical protein
MADARAANMTCYENDINNMADERAVNATWLNSRRPCYISELQQSVSQSVSIRAVRQSVLECEPSQSVSIPAEWLQWVVSWESSCPVESLQWSSSLQRRVASEQILRCWKTGNQWRHSKKTRQVL